MSSSAKLPASDNTENDNASVPADVIMSVSAVDHSTDPISQEAMERLEMRRLGLPLSFGARRKKKPKIQKSRTGNKNAPTYRKAAAAAAANSVVDSSSGKWQVEARAGEQQTISYKNPLSTLPADDFELIDFEEATANEEKLELMAEVASSRSSSSGPDEVTTLKLTDDSFDFVELDKLDKLRISGGDDDDDDNDESEDYKSEQQQQPNKRDRPEDDTTTTTSATSSEVSREEFTQSASHHSNHHHHHHHSLKKKRSKRAMNNTYYKQRFLLFSRFAEGICLDRESWYSVTPEPIARHIAERIERALLGRADGGGQQKEDITTMPLSSSSGKKFIILDGFCGAGGNTIQFALMPSTALVLAVDIDPRKIELARHNAAIYGCLDKIQFIVADFFEVIQSIDQDGISLPWWAGLVDACFLSPPWGGPDYLTYESYSLAQMTPDGFEIARRVADRITKNISFLLPRNFDLGEMPALSAIVYRRSLMATQEEQGEKAVEIEENLLYKKVKTLTAYFGDLVIKKEGEDGGEEVATLLKTAQVCSPPPLLLADEDEEEEE